MKFSLKWTFYRWVMKVAHRFDWHYAPKHGPLEDGRTQAWCQWCGLRGFVPDLARAKMEIRADSLIRDAQEHRP